MKQILSDYSGNYKSIYIVFIGDIHFGNKYFNDRYLRQALDFIDANRNRCRIVLMGDLLESATKTSVGRSVYDENFPTQEQFELAVKTFKPYADLIDLVIEGNHEERIIKDTSFEITQEFCHRIGRFKQYGKFSSVLNVRMASGLVYSIYAWHGAGSGTTEANAINHLLKMRERCISHIYVMGHTHKLLSFPRKIKVPQPDKNEIMEIEQLFINTGCSLDYGGYGEQKGMPMVKIGYGAVQLYSDERIMVFHPIESLLKGV